MENRNHPARALIYAYAVLSMVFWGFSFIWTTIALRQYDPITIIFVRLVISSGILWLFIAMTRKAERIRRQDRALILLSSLFNPFLYFLGENFGLRLSTPTITAVIIATIPVFTPIMARIVLHERLPALSYAGMLISFAGIGVMILNPDLSLKTSLTGTGLLFLAVMSAVVYAIFLKRLVVKYSALTIIAYQNLLGAFYFLPLFLIFDLGQFLAVKPDGQTISAMLQLAVFASSVAYILYTITIKGIGVSRANVFSNLIPVFTAIFSFIFIREIFTAAKVAGMVIVITGVFISQSGNRQLKKLKDL